MRYILFFTFFSLLSVGTGQQTILKMDVGSMEENIYKGEKGPNKKKFTKSFVTAGISYDYYIQDFAKEIVPNFPERSFAFSLGTLHKRKLNNVFSVGFDYYLGFKNVTVTDIGFIMGTPDVADYNREKFTFFTLGTTPWLRINYGPKRGNTLGSYIDFGGYGNWHFHSRHRFINAAEKFMGTKDRVVTLSRPGYLFNLEYGAVLRFGFKNILLYNHFRLSRLVNNAPFDTGASDLPRFTTGVMIGFW